MSDVQSLKASRLNLDLWLWTLDFFFSFLR